MKKLFIFAAAACMLTVSCQEIEKIIDETTDKLIEITTAKENLVVYMPLESADKAVTLGDGITFGSKNGTADFAKGEVGNGYTNTSGKNEEAYLKFNLASDNALRKIDDVTITLWTKNIEEFQKGGFISVNGKNFENQDWPSFIVYLDNKGVEKDEEGNETGVKTQQVNGRLMFKNAEGQETNMWLDTWDKAFAVYDKWFQVGFTYDHTTGAWALYVDGVKVKDAEYGDKVAFNKCIPEDATALYVGGWASFIEKYTGAADWQMYYAGSIDEIRFFNKALSETEMAELYKEEVKNSLIK